MDKDKRKEYQREYQRKLYHANREKRMQKTNEYLKEQKRWWNEEIMSKASCTQCGFSHPGALDFHHRDPSAKEGAVTRMVLQKRSKKAILEEIAKCDVLCSNCHRILHWNERNSGS